MDNEAFIDLNLLQTIQIMVGLFSTGLGPGGISTGPEDFASRGGVYWLSGVVKGYCYVNITMTAYYCNVSCFANAAMFLQFFTKLKQLPKPLEMQGRL